MTNSSNSSSSINVQLHNPWDDAIWILTCSFIIFTMQSGFGLLESGMVSRKHEINILVKNIADVLFGGLAFWMFGYAFSFGNKTGSNMFIGFGDFFVDADGDEMGWVYSRFFFQASFSTTATTIVSGSMAERVKLEAYCLFSFLNTIIFCMPAHWLWSEIGWLRALGAYDAAGACTVHLVGGVTGLVATIVLKPRTGRFEDEDVALSEMGAPSTAILGLFMLWWGWLALNCGSTFGVTDGKWKIAARAAVMTINASVGGGVTAILLSYITKQRKFDVKFLIRGVLGSLVSISGICGWAQPWEAIIIGAIGALIACYSVPLLELMHIDDPVGSISIHLFPAIWANVATGLFMQSDSTVTMHKGGIFKTGTFKFLGVQILATIVVAVWCIIMSYVILFIIKRTIGLRVSYQEEVLGADIVEHSLGGYSKARRGGVSKATPNALHSQNVEADLDTIVNNLERLRKLADMHMLNEKDGNEDSVSQIEHSRMESVDQFSDDEEFEEPIVPPPRVRFVYK